MLIEVLRPNANVFLCACECRRSAAWLFVWHVASVFGVCVAHARQYFRHTVSMPTSGRKHLTTICKKSREYKMKSMNIKQI